VRRRSEVDEVAELLHYPKVFTTCRNGLLFADRKRGFTGEDIVRLMLQEDIRRQMGAAFLALRIRHGQGRWNYAADPSTNKTTDYSVMLTASAEEYVVSSSPAGKGNFMYLRVDDVVVATPLDALIDRCWMLNKALGCHTCPMRGAECLWTNLGTELTVLQQHRPEPSLQLMLQLENTALLSTAMLRDAQSPYRQRLEQNAAQGFVDDLKPWKSTLAGFLYIPEGLTSADPLCPGNKGHRSAPEHHFTDLEDARGRLAERSRAAAKTRNFIQQQCKQCYFGGKYSACNQWRPRHCDHGAWTETRLVDYTLECARQRLLEMKSSFTLNQIWAVAHICGDRFERKDDRTGRIAEFVVQRMGEGAAEPCVFVSRTARDARKEMPALQFLSLKDLRRFLPESLQQKLDAVSPLAKAEHRRQLALWLQLSITSHGRSYSFFFSSKKDCGFAWAQPRVGIVKLHFGGVAVELWLAKFEREYDFPSFQKILDHYECLPYFGIAEGEDAPLGRPLRGNIR
jgi:hypothetical protein